MRSLTDHKVNGLNDSIEIAVLDKSDSNGGNHHYEIVLFDTSGVPTGQSNTLVFQSGPIREVGVNGISNEALLAVIIDRMRGFQSGQLASRETAISLTKLEEAMLWLQKRTRDRTARGVEGTYRK